MRKLKSLFLLVLLLALGACGGGDTGDQATGEPAEEPAEPTLCPLTGVETTIDVERPALAIKVDNAPPSRPQVGIQAADIVYEEISEGGLTRFLAIFHCSDAPRVGTVRSARTADPDILQEYAPVLFGYSGANPEVLEKVASTRGVIDLKHGSNGDAYSRDSSRRAPYNLFTGTDRIRNLPAAREVRGEPQSNFVFDSGVLDAPSAPAGGTGTAAAPAGNSVAFSYSNTNNVRWSYDPGTKRYLRFHGDAPHRLDTGEQVSATNVVVMKVRISTGRVRDASGAPTQDTNVIGSGELTVLRGGAAVTGTWSRANASDRTSFADASGQAIELAPGNTWIHLVPQERPVTVQ